MKYPTRTTRPMPKSKMRSEYEMMDSPDSDESYGTAGVPSPQDFRAQGTGIGQSRSASLQTGKRRAQRVIDAAPLAQQAVADRSYPAPSSTMPGYDMMSHSPRMIYQRTLKRK